MGTRLVHVAIQFDDTHKIEATTQGIVMTMLADRVPLLTWDYRSHALPYAREAHERALCWLREEVGKEWRRPHDTVIDLALYTMGVRRYASTALAIAYLSRAGGIDLGHLEVYHHRVAPGALAQHLGIT